MKKKLLNTVFILLLGSLFPSYANAGFLEDNGVVLKLNNSYILYSYQEMPYIDENGRTLIPLRLVSDLMGAQLVWDAKEQTANLFFDNVKAQVSIGKKEAFINEKLYALDTVAVLRNKTAMVPVRFIAKFLEIPIEWDAKYRVVSLRNKNFFKAPILYNIDQMENLDTSFKGNIVPQKVSFIKAKDPERNKLTILLFNTSDTIIGAEQLHKNLYWYRSETSAGGDVSLGRTSPRGKMRDPRGYNPDAIPSGGNFLDQSNVLFYKISGDSFFDSEGKIKYIICNYFKISR